MSMSSLAQIPLTILFALAVKKNCTAPNPPASEKEVFVKGGLNRSWYLGYVPLWAQRLQILESFAESITILAYHHPNLPYTQAILSALTFPGGNPANLQLTPVTLIGCIMMLTGTFIRVITYRYLGRFFRFEASIQKDHQLITSGPYSIVRHPSYTGLLLTQPGWFLWHFGAGSWIRASGLLNTVWGKLLVGSVSTLAVLGALYITLSRMGSEDRALQKTFGKQWEEWAKRVRYMVIPGIY